MKTNTEIKSPIFSSSSNSVSNTTQKNKVLDSKTKDFIKSTSEIWLRTVNKEKNIKSMDILRTLQKAGYKSAPEKILILKQIKHTISKNSSFFRIDGVGVINKKIDKLISKLNVEEPDSKHRKIISTIKKVSTNQKTIISKSIKILLTIFA